jgi:predicted RecB family nuclease
MAEAVTSGRPRPTSGQFFSSLQSCPQRAWADYHLPAELKAKPPAFLGALQQEGVEHERRIYQECFPDAVEISTNLPPAVRARKTIEAMKSGASAILQAYFIGEDRVGVADVIEWCAASPSSPVAHLYQVGEVKRSPTLAMAHVLQAAWYTELLAGIQKQPWPEAFFILGDGSRHVVRLEETAAIYADQKAALEILRRTDARPGPHLCRACATCTWRGVCMPELSASEHVSLVPAISRPAAARLRIEAGISSWRQLATMTDTRLNTLGIPGEKLPSIRAAVEQLQAQGAVTQSQLNRIKLRRMSAVTAEYSQPPSATQEHAPPGALWVAPPSSDPTRIEVSADWTADLSPIATQPLLAVYGATEMAVTQRILRAANARGQEVIDLLAVVENFVHAPFAGLELEHVAGFVSPPGGPLTRASSRLAAMRSLIDWMAAA